MNFIPLALWFLMVPHEEILIMQLPQPTDEIKKLVVELGDDKFRVREKASKKLKELGYKSLKACILAERNTTDPEVRHRARAVVNSYLSVNSDDEQNPTPSIWHLPEKTRFPLGHSFERWNDYCHNCKPHEPPSDIARYFYERARSDYNIQAKRYRFQEMSDSEWRASHIEAQATRNYVRYLLLSGKTHKEVKALLNEMVESEKSKTLLEQTEYEYEYGGGGHGRPPGPAIK